MSKESLKIVILGNPTVGKTTLWKTFTGQEFNPHYRPTLGADYAFTTMKLSDHQIKITLWDLSGQTRFQESQAKYIVGADSAIVMYEISSPDPLETIMKWIETYLESSGNQNEPVLVIQNKIDLISQTDEKQILKQHDEVIEKLKINFIDKISIIGAQISAKTGENVEIAMDDFFRQLYFFMKENRRRNRSLSKQMMNGLYSKSAYLMNFDEDYGPVILAKSPAPEILEFSQEEITNAVRLFAGLDFEDLITIGYRIGRVPWSHEDGTVFYIAFTLPNEQRRGGYDLFITSVIIDNVLTGIISDALSHVEGFLLNTMNQFTEILHHIQVKVDSYQDLASVTHSVTEQSELIGPLSKLRETLDKLIRELLLG